MPTAELPSNRRICGYLHREYASENILRLIQEFGFAPVEAGEFPNLAEVF